MIKIEKKVILKEGLEAKLTIYPVAQLAIDKGWESLYFSSNNETFATIETEDKIITLVTNGEVKLIKEGSDTLVNCNQDEIRALIDTKKDIELEIGYDFLLNNWFSLMYGTIEKDKPEQFSFYDDFVYESEDESVEKLEAYLIQVAKDEFLY